MLIWLITGSSICSELLHTDVLNRWRFNFSSLFADREADPDDLNLDDNHHNIHPPYDNNNFILEVTRAIDDANQVMSSGVDNIPVECLNNV